MKFTEHGLSMVMFFLGTLTTYRLTKKHTATFFLVLGLAIGLFNHVMIQDEWGYGKQLFQDTVIDLKHTRSFDIREILCNIGTGKWTCGLNSEKAPKKSVP